MHQPFSIRGRAIGSGHPALIVAELSANHGFDRERAARLIVEARRAGADAVKLQTYTPATMTIEESGELFTVRTGPWAGTNLHDLYKSAYTPWEWHAELRDIAEQEGLLFFSTPFDETAVEFLEALHVPAYKIASFEIVDTGLLKRVGSCRKPVIVSTGMATLGEISEAVETLRSAGAPEIALLKCTSAYPAPLNEMNLVTIPSLAREFQLTVGLSDHTLGMTCAVGAVALGASIVEKHLTLSRRDGGPDAQFSAEPAEFADLVQAVRDLERALGSVRYEPTAEEAKSLVFRRSLFAVCDIHTGEAFTKHNVRSIRPGYGLAPRHLDKILGRRAVIEIKRGTPLSWDLIER